MTEKITLTIDDKEIEADPGKSLLEAALAGGIYIPHLCHHPDLPPTGECGLCVVEVLGAGEPVVSCTAPAEAGQIVRTKTPEIEQRRKEALTRLLVDHPPECSECSQYLNCELQSVKQYVGVIDDPAAKTKVIPIPVDRSNPLLVHDFIKCIKCGRCVRACHDLRGAQVLQFIEADGQKRVGVPDGRSLIEAGCRFCAACVEVCPTGAMRDREELLEGKKRREAAVPCRYACPAQIDAPRYIRFIREGRPAEAAAVVREKAPFPGVLGHVCQHPCESACRRNELGGAVSIRDLKRFAAHSDRDGLWKQRAAARPSSGKRAAVIGSGPAGLTAAYILARLGHEVTVFEARPLPGGMLRYGIPEYRLPREVLDEEIREIENQGVAIKTGARIESLDDLVFGQGFDAVLVAVGAGRGVGLPLPGADLDRVFIGLDFLTRVNSGEKVDLGRKVLVLGGGNVAVDCARSARRLGAVEVGLACLESMETMPASPEEIKEAQEEGIVIYPGRTFTQILGESGCAAGAACLEVASVEFDENGVPDIDAVPGSEHALAADAVIIAVGQRPDIPEGFDLDLTERRLIEVDPYTLDTSQDGVFAAGDAAGGPSSVIEAVASARKAAAAVDRYLGGGGEIDEALASPPDPETWFGPDPDLAQRKRLQAHGLGPAERLQGFCPASSTLDPETAAAESARCLRCDSRLTITPVRYWGNF